MARAHLQRPAAPVWVDVETVQGCRGAEPEWSGGRTRLSEGSARRLNQNRIGGRQNGPEAWAGRDMARRRTRTPHRGRRLWKGVNPYTLFCHGPRGTEDDRTRPAALPFLISPSSITSKASLFPSVSSSVLYRVRKAAPTFFCITTLLSSTTHHDFTALCTRALARHDGGTSPKLRREIY